MMSIQILSLSEVQKNGGILRTKTVRIVRHGRVLRQKKRQEISILEPV